MDELIEALQFIKQFMFDPTDRYFAQAEHDIWYIHGIDLEKMTAADVRKLCDYGFYPGMDDDYTSEELQNIGFEDITDIVWNKHKYDFSNCLHSYRYGSC